MVNLPAALLCMPQPANLGNASARTTHAEAGLMLLHGGLSRCCALRCSLLLAATAGSHRVADMDVLLTFLQEHSLMLCSALQLAIGSDDMCALHCGQQMIPCVLAPSGGV